MSSRIPAALRRVLAALALATLIPACADEGEAYRADLNEVMTPDPAACLDPRDYGAVLNDGLDDRVALQATIDAAKPSGRPICLPPGRLDVVVNPGVGGTNVESLKIWNTDGFTMVGAGARSVLALKGTGIRPGGWQPGTWWVLGVRGTRDTRLAHFKIDASARYETSEQTHLIQLAYLPANYDHNTAPLSNLSTHIDHVDFYDPQPAVPAGSVVCKTAPDGTMCERPHHGGSPVLCSDIGGAGRCTVTPAGPGGASVWTLLGFYSGGDCVRTLAEESLGTVVADTTVEGSHAVCDRSFVSLQRGTDGYRVLDNTVDAVGDQAIDEEPTGEGSVYRAYIAGNTFHRGPGRKDGPMITMTGNAPGRLESQDNVITANLLEGSIFSYDASDTEISFNTINIVDGAGANVTFIKYGSGNRILGNTLVREASAPPGAAIAVGIHNSGYPSDTTITGNVIRMYSDGNAIVAEPGVGMLVANNVIESQAPTAATYSAFFSRGVEIRDEHGVVLVASGVERVTFIGNQVRGNFRRMVHIGQYLTNVNHSVMVSGNIYEPVITTQTRPVIYGVDFQVGCPTPAPVVDANVFRGVAANLQVVGPCGTGWVGTNSGP